MSTVAQQAKDIVQCLEGVVSAFEAASIGSNDYRDKAMLVHWNVTALAELHPNWSEERKLILNRDRHDAPPLDEDDPFVLIYEHSEVLFRAWHQMKVPRPSVRTLTVAGKAFRAALANLHNECDELANSKASQQPTESLPPVQSAATVTEV